MAMEGVCVCVLVPHLSFLSEILKAEICMMGVHSSWMDERGMGMGGGVGGGRVEGGGDMYGVQSGM